MIYGIEGSKFLKNRHFLSKKDLINQYIVINTIIKCGIWSACKISVSLSFLNWIKNEMIFYHISESLLSRDV